MSEGPWPDYLFDIGNVILFFDYRRFARGIEVECACAAEEVLEVLREDLWRLEAGSLASGEFLDRAFDRIGYRGSREKFVRAWQGIFEPNEPVIDFVHSLADGGHRLFLLSNTNQLQAEFFLREYAVFERFQGHVFSYEAGCMKPEPEIFRAAIRKLGLKPERTVYLDDLEPNVETAAALGFLPVRYVGQPVHELRPERWTWRMVR